MIHESLYRQVVHQAIKISWRHKHLWIFGFFAAILGIGGVVETVLAMASKGVLFVANLAGDITITYPGQDTINALVSSSGWPLVTTIIFAVGSAALTLAYLWMSGVSASALVHAGLDIPRNKDVHFSDGLAIGSKHAWKVLITSLLAKLITFALAAIVSVALWQLIKQPSFIATGFFIASLIVLGSLAIAFNAFATFIIMAVVARDESLVEAARSAAIALRGRWILAIEAALLTFIMTLGIGILGFALAAAILMPITVLYLLSAAAGLTGALVLLTTISAVTIVAVIVFTGSLVATFQTIAWTLIWNRMAENRAVAKIHRLWDNMKAKFI